MAESSMKDIKLRIKSVESTMQITKAMQLVATSKMRRSKERMENSRPYHEISREAFADAVAGCAGGKIPYVTPREVKKRCYVVIAGDRGLAGGYNNNIFKTVAATADEVPYCVLPVGRKALDKYQHMGIEILDDGFLPVAQQPLRHCYNMARIVCDGYREGKFDEVVLVWTNFKSMLTQEARSEVLLPVRIDTSAPRRPVAAVYEPDAETMIESVVPDMVAGILYSAICDASASENAARRNAMDSATKNADAMISSLRLHYNRARQGSITQEITEIVAGAEK